MHLARRLGRPDTANRLDAILRGRQALGVGIVLSSAKSPFGHIGPNVVIAITEHLTGEATQTLAINSIGLAFQTGRNLALGGSTIALLRSGAQSAVLYIPGKQPLPLHSSIQIKLFDVLITAHLKDSPDVHWTDMLRGSDVKSPGDAFNSQVRSGIVGQYFEKAKVKGFWRLVA